MSLENREFEVELVVTTRHLYTTLSRTAEEAEADAENMLEDGDLGDVISREIEVAEAFPLEDFEEEEAEDDEDILDD